MAEKPDDQVTTEEKIQKAKELYGRGCRNYYVKCYSDSADDLSEAAKLYGEVYGVDGDELGDVYLLYAKALIAVGQNENKLIEVPENEDEDEPVEEDDGETEQDGEKLESINEEKEESSEKTNGHDDGKEKEEDQDGKEEEQDGKGEVKNSEEAGPSSTAEAANEDENSNDADEEEENNEEDGGNLEVAWEVLQNAALIFKRQEEKGLSNLLEVYNEMAGISMENGNFTVALDDFARALNTFDCIEDNEKNHRIAAEIHYKIGLCQCMEKLYDEAVKAFQKAHDLISDVIVSEKAKEEQTEEIAAKIKDLQETQQEILNKITEIGEVKAEEIEEVKRELTKLYGMNGSAVDGAGCSSSSSSNNLTAAAVSNTTDATMKSPESDKPKPTDISHLIKRKKPDTADVGVESSPAKKKALETSPGEKVAVPIEDRTEEENKEKKTVEESATVQVAVDN